jgi:biotin carboxyl carrier protein
MRLVVTVGDTVERVEVSGADGRYQVAIGDQRWEVDARLTAQGICSLLIDGVSWLADVTPEADAAATPAASAFAVQVGGESYLVRVEEETRYLIRTRGGAAAAGGQTLTAPLPGKITHIAVRPGDTVGPGDTLVVIEAMKMENEFKAARAGTVREVRVAPGQAVNPGDVLVVLE